jgi:hypothetical protein
MFFLRFFSFFCSVFLSFFHATFLPFFISYTVYSFYSLFYSFFIPPLLLIMLVLWRKPSSWMCLQPPAHSGSSLTDFYTLKMEAICSYETSVYTISTRHHIPEDGVLYGHCRENLKSYLLVLCSDFLVFTSPTLVLYTVLKCLVFPQYCVLSKVFKECWVLGALCLYCVVWQYVCYI